jgi:hypothetical protein
LAIAANRGRVAAHRKPSLLRRKKFQMARALALFAAAETIEFGREALMVAAV